MASYTHAYFPFYIFFLHSFSLSLNKTKLVINFMSYTKVHLGSDPSKILFFFFFLGLSHTSLGAVVNSLNFVFSSSTEFSKVLYIRKFKAISQPTKI
ncbi:hypothetical protein CLU79DRAFT_760606 [Phycomyces nitens]|nr:hypothetical protein CLU79DRAFT_760606 [Phycomyces nitens]